MASEWYAWEGGGIAQRGDAGTSRASRIQGDIIVDSGTFQQAKVKGPLDLDNGGVVTAAAAYPAAANQRGTFDSNGLKFYNASNTQTSGINQDGSGFFGTGATAITWNSAGVLTVPAASIGSLTIANVGGGVFGGTYTSSAAGARIELSVAGGYKQYDATTLRSALLPDGSGFLGSSGGTSATAALSWSTAGGSVTIKNTLTIGAGGKIIDADGSYWDQSGIQLSGTGAAGDNIGWWTSGVLRASVNSSSTQMTIGASSGVDMHLFARGADPSITLTSAGIALLAAGFTPSSAVFETTNMRVRFGGRIYPGDGTTSPSQSTRYISDNGAQTFVSADVLIGGKVYPNNQATRFFSDNGTQLTTSAALVVGGNLYPSGQTARWFYDTGTYLATNSTAGLVVGGSIFPSNQTYRAFTDDGANLSLQTNTLQITGSSGAAGINFTNIANGGSASTWSSFTVANIPDKSAAYLKVSIGGTNYRVPFYGDS